VAQQTGALTLAAWSKTVKDPIEKGVMLGVAIEGVVADLLPWRNVNSLQISGFRYDEVLVGEYVPIDGDIPSGYVEGKPLQYSIYAYKMHIDIPYELVKYDANQLEPAVKRQFTMAERGVAYVVNDRFINGDQAVDPFTFNGIAKLVTELDTNRQIVGSTELDITTYSSTVAQDILDRIHEGMHKVEGHLPTAGFANSDFLLKFESILRREQVAGNDYNWAEKALQVDDPRRTQRTASTRPALVYRGVPFYDLGTKEDLSTLVIGNSYAEAGSAGATRVFFVKIGDEDLEGLQGEPLSIKLVAETLHDRDVQRYRLRWTHGLANWGPRSIVMVRGIKVV